MHKDLDNVEIIEVNSKKDLRRFIEFPTLLYANHPYYVSNLYLSEKKMLSSSNPFLKHSQLKLYLAVVNKKVVGRIASIYNSTHLRKYQDQTGFFGFFDAINDVDIAKLLFNAASKWLKYKGLIKIMGPTNLTTNDSCGFLAKGFDQSPMVMMPYNYDYYNTLSKACGFKPVKELFSYEVDGKAILEKYENVLLHSKMKLSKNNGITIRSLSTKTFKNDMQRLRNVYNECNKNNWGFVPLDENEFSSMANDLKSVAPLDMSLIVEKNNQIIAFLVAVPDLNQALCHLNGKLFPFGLIKLLWYKRKINKARIIILGILPEYSNLGIGVLLYQKIKEVLNNHRVYTAEACYVLESNKAMNSILNKLKADRKKHYKIYNKLI